MVGGYQLLHKKPAPRHVIKQRGVPYRGFGPDHADPLRPPERDLCHNRRIRELSLNLEIPTGHVPGPVPVSDDEHLLGIHVQIHGAGEKDQFNAKDSIGAENCVLFGNNANY